MPTANLPQMMLDALSDTFAPKSLGTLGSGAAALLPDSIWSEALKGPLLTYLARPSKALRGDLVQLGFDYARGDSQPRTLAPTSVFVAVEAFHAGSLVIDDIEDGSLTRRGGPALHRMLGTAPAINSGNWLYFWPFELLEGLLVSDEQKLFIMQTCVRALGECHYGQALDITLALPGVPQAEVLAVTQSCSELKTGSLMGLAASLGAAVGGASFDNCRALGDYGRSLGVGLQMLDDLSGALVDQKRNKVEEDLRLGRVTWPFAFIARSVAPDTWDTLMETLTAVRGGGAVEPLVTRLRELLGADGLAHINSHFERSFLSLETALGHSARLEALRGFAKNLIEGFLPGGAVP